MEKKLQIKVRKYLRSKGCLVLTMSPMPGVPTGFPDILFMKEGFYGALELKASEKAAFQPLQEHFIEKIGDWSYARVVWPENWDEVQLELESML